MKALLAGKEKVKDIWEDDRTKRNYLTRMNIDDARVWFRYRSKMTVRVKANRSSEFRNNMGCRQCKSDEVESQAH